MSKLHWDEKPGGLLLAVETVDPFNPKHLETVVHVMHHTFQSIAQKHGAKFDSSGLRGNLNAILTGRMHADLYRAKWKACAEEICVGAAFGWNTYGFTPGGVLVKAEYTEDVALPGVLLKQLIRAKPTGMEFPDEILAECFERISLRNMLQKKGAKYRYGEVNTDNTTMMRQLIGNNALIGIGNDSALIEFNRFPNNLMDRFPMNAAAYPIFCNGAEDINNFLVRCREGEHDKRFIVTNAQSTGKGKPRVDVHGWDNGTPVVKPIQDCVIASSLLAIKREVEERGWGKEKPIAYPDALAPLMKARPDLAATLYPQGDIIAVKPDSQSTFFAPIPDETHIFVHENKPLLDGLYKAGGAERVYGTMPMKPVVNILAPRFG